MPLLIKEKKQSQFMQKFGHFWTFFFFAIKILLKQSFI